MLPPESSSTVDAEVAGQDLDRHGGLLLTDTCELLEAPGELGCGGLVVSEPAGVVTVDIH
jgi:hypothetical protein